MATAPTLYWYQLDTGTLMPTYYGQLDATVAALCSENAVTAPTAPWSSQISCSLVSTWLKQIDTAVRALCTALGVDAPATTLTNLNVGQYEATYWAQLDAAVRALCGPVNYVTPAITPDPAVAGDLLTVSNGTWSSGANPVYTYQWWVDGAEVVGETDQTYQTSSPSEDDSDVYCVVTLTNDTGESSAQSNTITLGAGTGYHADAVHFDGGPSFLAREAVLTGVADSPLGLFSQWIKSGDPLEALLLGVNVGTVEIAPAQVALLDTAGTTYLDKSYTATLANGAWHHVLMAWNTNFTIDNRILQIYVDDVAVIPGADAGAGGAFDVAYTQEDFWFLGPQDGVACDMADYYFAPGQFLDFTVDANRRKFISATGKPVYLGADGSTPTGTAPALFLTGDATTFGTNVGTGGAFTLTGVLTNASTSPSD